MIEELPGELRFAVIPAIVLSESDCGIHTVAAHDLVKLYHLREGEYRIVRIPGLDLRKYLYVRPRSDGNYPKNRQETIDMCVVDYLKRRFL